MCNIKAGEGKPIRGVLCSLFEPAVTKPEQSVTHKKDVYMNTLHSFHILNVKKQEKLNISASIDKINLTNKMLYC